MQEVVRQAIERVYFRGDHEFLRMRCREPLEMPDRFLALLSDPELDDLCS